MKRLRMSMPDKGLASWWMLGRVLRFIFESLRLRLQVEGAEEISQTADGLRLKFAAGGVGEEWDDDVPAPGGPMSCTVCANTPLLMAKTTVTCGSARCCGAAIIPPGEDPITEWAGLVETTVNARMWDYTGPELVTYSCQVVTTTDYNPDGNGTAAGPCPNSPVCGDIDVQTDGCDDAPQCSDTPAPGYKCWVPLSSERSDSKICNSTTLASAALGAADPVTEPEFTTEAVDAIAGSSSMLVNVTGHASIRSWEFKRFKSRMPVHIVMIIEVRNTETNEVLNVFEEIVTLDASTDYGIYTLDPGGTDQIATVLSCNIIYGRLPEE